MEVERRLDSSIFFRASRDCIVNLSQVKQPRFLKDGGLSFLLRNGKEVLFSRRQSVLSYDTRPLAEGIQRHDRLAEHELTQNDAF